MNLEAGNAILNVVRRSIGADARYVSLLLGGLYKLEKSADGAGTKESQISLGLALGRATELGTAYQRHERFGISAAVDRVYSVRFVPDQGEMCSLMLEARRAGPRCE